MLVVDHNIVFAVMQTEIENLGTIAVFDMNGIFVFYLHTYVFFNFREELSKQCYRQRSVSTCIEGELLNRITIKLFFYILIYLFLIIIIGIIVHNSVNVDRRI